MFTNQHINAIADIIKSNTQNEPDAKVNESVATVINSGGRYIGLALADYFTDDNPRFDRQKFLEACGIS